MHGSLNVHKPLRYALETLKIAQLNVSLPSAKQSNKRVLNSLLHIFTPGSTATVIHASCASHTGQALATRCSNPH